MSIPTSVLALQLGAGGLDAAQEPSQSLPGGHGHLSGGKSASPVPTPQRALGLVFFFF